MYITCVKNPYFTGVLENEVSKSGFNSNLPIKVSPYIETLRVNKEEITIS